MPWYMCRGQRITCMDWFSPSIMGVPGNQIQIIRLGSKCLYLLSHLSGLLEVFFK